MGEESVLELLQGTGQLLETALESPQSSKSVKSVGVIRMEVGVIRIDHMNDAQGYQRKLGKFTEQAGAGGWLFCRRRDGCAVDTSNGSDNNDRYISGTERLEGIFVVLVAADQSHRMAQRRP